MKIVENLDARQADGETYEKRVGSTYSIMKATSDISQADSGDGFAGFSQSFIQSLVDICESKSPTKEAEFVAAALKQCSGSTCKWKP